MSRLEPIVAQTGGTVALEVARRAILEVARGAVGTVRARLAGETVVYASQAQSLQEIDHFLGSLSLDTIDPTVMEPCLVRLCHALDHLSVLERDLARIPPAVSGWQPPTSFEAGVRALDAWLNATAHLEAAVDPAICLRIEEASKQLSEESVTRREQLLGDIALQRAPAATARGALDTLVWADAALYHAWRLAESLRLATVARAPSPILHEMRLPIPHHP